MEELGESVWDACPSGDVRVRFPQKHGCPIAPPLHQRHVAILETQSYFPGHPSPHPVLPSYPRQTLDQLPLQGPSQLLSPGEGPEAYP